MTKRIITTARVLPDGKPFKLIGRYGWALKNLVAAGKRGCTPIDHPGPRWSAYVHRLRKDYGIVIETINEAHDGPFPGSHARYVLHVNRRRNGTPYRLPKGTPASSCIGSARVGPGLSI